MTGESNESSNALRAANAGAALVGELVTIAKDDPNAKEAAGNVGKTAVTLTKAINNALLPLAAVNFAFDAARDYFASRFQKEVEEKTKDIPPESLVEPKASIAGPALQGLAFAHEEEQLKDLFLNLLASAMDGRRADTAHPAFVEIIKQLDSDEATYLKAALLIKSIPIVSVRVHSKTGNNSFIILTNHLMGWRNLETDEFVDNRRVPAMIDNWIRLGLVSVAYDRFITQEGRYDWVEKHPAYVEFKATHDSETQEVRFERGVFERTRFGELFGNAVGILVS